ncbi:MAG: TolC family protein [Muribaculaceae bacterium]|nr:TolC family protein [Muribaculaceae bacterium]
MKKKIFTLFLMATVISASAGEKFQQLLETLVSSSPDIKAMILDHEAESEAAAQENMLAGPELEGFHKWGTERENKYGVGISQSFDWPGLYGARKAARKATDSALEQLRLSCMADRTLELKLLMIQLITTGEQLRVVEEAESNMSQLLQLYQRGFEAGEESILDVNKLKIEKLRLTRRLTSLRESRESILESILSIAGSSGHSADLLSLKLSDLPADAIADEAFYEDAAEHSPQMQYYRAMQESARQNERVARLSGYPSFSIGYEMEREDGQYFNGISVNIGLSSWSNRHRKAAARYRLMEQEVKMNSARLAEILRLRRIRSAALRARSEQQLFSEVLGSSNQSELLKKALDGGQISLMTYLQELGYFLDARCDYYETANNAAQLCAELNKYNLK